MLYRYLGALQVAAVLAAAATTAPASPIVKIGSTQYQGIAQTDSITSWFGIRYATPPIGDLRFRAPQDPVSSPERLQVADKHGDICIGTASKIVPLGYSEDCLFLDVYAPSNAPGKRKLPVYIFIQGGGFNSNATPNYKGNGLISASGGNIVIVTFNYRVGPYGFLSSQEIAANGNINNGLLDQRKAFQWVRDNIAKFGGNPHHVTIGGGSAGAASVALHLSAYGGRDDGLFHAGAAESTSFGLQYTVSESQFQYDTLVKNTNCADSLDTLDCLRQLSSNQIQAAQTDIPTPGGAGGAPVFPYSVVIDQDLVTDYTYKLFAEGKFLKLPTIFGADTNDGTLFAPRGTATVDAMNNFLQNNFPNLTSTQLARIDTLYPKAEQYLASGPYWRAASNAYGDMRYMCPGIAVSAAFASVKIPSWNYRYNVYDATFDGLGYGVPHTIDIYPIWGPENVNPPLLTASYNPGGTNANVVPLMQAYWTSFIRSYNPNTYRLAGSPFWLRYSRNNRILFEKDTSRMEKLTPLQAEQCAYLTSIGIGLRQ